MSNSGTAVLEELLEPVTRAFSCEVAEALMSIRARETTQARIAKLAEKGNEGLLTPAEQAEYEGYIQAMDLISVLQAKAQTWMSIRKTGFVLPPPQTMDRSNALMATIQRGYSVKSQQALSRLVAKLPKSDYPGK